MPYSCEWSDCKFTSDDFETFYCHVREHTKEFYDENDLTFLATPATCLWRECFSNTCETEGEFLGHVLFHGYHSLLKELGLKTEREAKLSPCTLDTQARNLVPELPGTFCCNWDKCKIVTYCPKYYYRHVDGHTLAMVKPDSNGFIPCKWEGNCSVQIKLTMKNIA